VSHGGECTSRPHVLAATTPWCRSRRRVGYDPSSKWEAEMIARPGTSTGIVRALVVATFLGVGLAAAAHASEPPAEPILCLAPGMHGAPIWRIGVDAASRYVVTSSWDKTVGVWDLKSGQLVR